ncbi:MULTISPECIES: DoxX family protein [Niastella]|uniref:DoxX family protein n=1 Tax=Niastella soli TaxID=2821487 RepID=A0ABS3Z090_9BACT|nr:DoxX family protein [Niastella soli]MBO9203586.1 DoxX family protein [Niastella soli]
MNTLQQIHRWSLAHHPRWLVVLRVALGVCLFFKGIFFLANTSTLQELVQGSVVANRSDWMVIFITWSHLLGGFLIIIGLLTRWAALLNVPILMGAVIFINTQRDSFGNFELPFAFIVLAMLIFFLIEGGGPISLDNFFSKHQA